MHKVKVEARIVELDSSESRNGRRQRPSQQEKVFGYEGNARSVMLIRGPVNKNERDQIPLAAKKHKTQNFLCASVALSKPTDDGEALTARHGQNFVKRIGCERRQ